MKCLWITPYTYFSGRVQITAICQACWEQYEVRVGVYLSGGICQICDSDEEAYVIRAVELPIGVYDDEIYLVI